MYRRLAECLGRPVDGASLAVARIAVGAMLVASGATLLAGGPGGRPLDYWFGADLERWTAKYPLFTWLEPWPQPWLEAWVYLLIVAGGCLVLGLVARLAAATGLVTWTYLWLLDATRFNNHYYLASLVLLLLATMPSDRCFSVTAWYRRRRGRPASSWVPFWTLLLLRGQMAVLYFYGGVAKLTEDYLVDAEPLRTVLADPHVAQTLGWLPAEIRTGAPLAFALAYAGLAYDVLIVPLVLMRRTRMLGLLMTVAFHALNHFMLFADIGHFPLMAVLLTTVFLDPDWPRRLGRWLRQPTVRAPDWGWLIAGAVLVPGIGAALGWKPRPAAREDATAAATAKATAAPRRTVILVCGWLVLQAVVPLRHLMIEGHVDWTSEGERFAWRMKSRAMQSGEWTIRIVDPPLVRCTRATPATRDAFDAFDADAETEPDVDAVADAAADAHAEPDADADLDGQPTIDWSQWQGTRVIYVDAPGGRLAWDELPEVLVTFEPLVGERLFWNRRSGSFRVQPFDEARARIEQLWRERLGRTVSLRVPVPLDQMVSALRLALSSAGAESDDQIHAAAVAASEAAAIWSEHPGGSLERDRALARLRAALSALLERPESAELVRGLLRGCEPLALAGGLAPADAVVVIDDSTLVRPAATGLDIIDEPSRSRLPPGTERTYIDLGLLSRRDWLSLPEVFPVAREGRIEFWWNPYLELDPLVRQLVQKNALVLHQYVGHLADRWETQYGRRPQIYVTDVVALHRRPAAPLVDPQVNLADAPLSYWKHNQWIMPRPERPVSERTETGAERAVPASGRAEPGDAE